VNEDNKKITMDEINKIDEELDLGDNYVEQIFQEELADQWLLIRKNQDKLDDIVRNSVKPDATSQSASPSGGGESATSSPSETEGDDSSEDN
jgi:hypothetical protein